MNSEVSTILLPRTAGCLVCGPNNPRGLGMRFRVDAKGVVHSEYSPRAEEIGFDGVTHGGMLATVLDEAMVWSATWSGKRACLAAEMTIRYRLPGTVGQTLRVEAEVTAARSRLIQTSGRLFLGDRVLAEATGKYVPVSEAENRRVLTTFIDESGSEAAMYAFRSAAGLAGK